MLLKVIDGQGILQTVVTAAQEAVVDESGSIAVTGTSQLLLAANNLRSGWMLQNLGSNVMWVNDLGSDAVPGAGSFKVEVGGFFPPAGFPLSASEINIVGTTADAFTVREW